MPWPATPPGRHPTRAANCIPHGRRKFVEVYAAFPDEVAFVLESLRPVFRTDQQAKQDGLSPQQGVDHGDLSNWVDSVPTNCS